jgi:hypothetical protein
MLSHQWEVKVSTGPKDEDDPTGLLWLAQHSRDKHHRGFTWRGVPFRDGEADVLDDARHAELIEAALTHPWFSVDRDGSDGEEPRARPWMRPPNS